MMTKEEMISLMRKAGLKVTTQRLVIIDALIELEGFHPSAGQVYKQAKMKKEGLSLSTTYATLSEFARHGIIKTLQFDAMENRYEGNLEEHINLICDGCKKILDYHVPVSVNPRRVMKHTGFSITDTRLEYYGLCRDCREGEGSIKGKVSKQKDIQQ